MTNLLVRRIATGKWDENCYLIHIDGCDGLLIDPGADFETISAAISESRVTPRAIVNTHGHFDHVGAVAQAQEYYNIPFYLHPADSRLLKRANSFRALFEQSSTIRIPHIDVELGNTTETLVFAGMELEILHTPGHTEGSVCIRIGENVFTGDLLFKGHIGRTDLPGGNREKLRESLRLVCTLPRSTVLYPGHGDTSTIQDELAGNAALIEALNGN
jgi:glyoxylase-like metal-dependent hydrolase (beta-lactamase superfamily II)